MARSKPLSRKARRDLNSIAMREDFNRANQLRRDKDKTKNITNTLMDMDSAIMYYFNEVIKPTVVENKETVKVPVMYASPERCQESENHVNSDKIYHLSLSNLAPQGA